MVTGATEKERAVIETWVIEVLGSHPYLGLFLILLICGLGLPFPEDIPLVSSGYLSYLGHANLWWTIVVAMVGVMVGDTMLFFIGRRLGTNVTKSRLFGRLLTPKRFKKLHDRFERQGARVIFFSRFAAGIRGAMFLTAGVSGVSYRVFISMDFLAALITVPLLVALGHIFGDKIDWIRERIREGEMAIFVLLIVGVVLYIGFEIWRHRRRKREEQEVDMETMARAEVPPGTEELLPDSAEPPRQPTGDRERSAITHEPSHER